jgi:abhydrolase domain-containing protein 14
MGRVSKQEPGLKLGYPIVISPSMSGRYSLPLVSQNPEKLGGFVAVAPVGIPKFLGQLTGIKLPTLAIWGSNDSIWTLDKKELFSVNFPLN